MRTGIHLHAEHALVFEGRPTTRRASLSLAVTIAVLAVNAAAKSTTISAVGAGAGLVLLLAAPHDGRERARGALTWTGVLAAGAVLAALAAFGERELLVAAAARVLCGVTWTLWLGTQLDWAALRALLLRARMPQAVVDTLDQALLHGVLTQREWKRRRDAARTRLGRPGLPLAAWGPLLGEGALCAFTRLEAVNENAQLRGAGVGEALARTEVTPDARTGRNSEVQLEDVDVKRGGLLALKNVGLRVHAGEWLALCGPSGAGKSTLLRLIAGLERPQRGCVTRFGVRFGAESSLRERLDGRVALLSQHHEHHFIASTVQEDITWGLKHRGVDPALALQRTHDVAAALGLAGLLERPCHQLSFGEQRRVAIAGLLVLEPKLLLLDEPTAGLDPVAAQALCGQVRDIARRTGLACVWATHDLHALPSEIERVMLLNAQTVVFDGPRATGLSTLWLVRSGLALN
ncbi:MAG: ABC transporter ATP-binding protein [Planctomycetes bacterium]|nr:ABC transporter ATP-binding protein [Planctomycetota bacterium]